MRIGPSGYDGDLQSSPVGGLSNESPPIDIPGARVAICTPVGEGASSSLMVNVSLGAPDSFNLEPPNPLEGSPNVIPPLGPKPGVVIDSICGDETECFRPLRCNIDEVPCPIGSKVRLAVPVFKLNRLGFFLAFSGGGLINEGEPGSEVNSSMLGRRLRARLLGFFFLGEGEVIGRSIVIGGGLVSTSPIFKF